MPNTTEAPALERKTIAFEVKSFDDSTGLLKGYGNVKNVVDWYDDEVIDGAYIELADTVRHGFGAVGHDWYGLPVMTIEVAREDKKGLYVEMLFHSTPDAQKARTVVKERLERGKSVGLSIGYFVVECAYEEREGKEVRVLKKIRVVEVSVVTVPANPQSHATAVKDGSGATFGQKLENALDAFDDIASRFEWFAANRKKGLSEKHVAQIGQVKARLDALLAAKAEGEGKEPVDPETARLLEARALEQKLRTDGLLE